MKNLNKSVTIFMFPLLLLSGCTNYLYQGTIQAKDSMGIEREVVLYWNKTDSLIGKDKASLISVLTQCGSLITYDETESGIVFRGEAGREINAETGQPIVDKFICGKVVNSHFLTELGQGDLGLTIVCKPAPADDEGFGTGSRNYIAAQEEPYIFDIKESSKWNIFGATHDAPVTPACDQ